MCASVQLMAGSWVTPEVLVGSLGSVPVSGDNYYLYNTGAGQFLTKGNAWGTQASIGASGMEFTWTGSDDGKGNTVYTVKFTSTNKFMFLDSETAAYTDMRDQGHQYWTFEDNGNATFRFRVSKTDATYGLTAMPQYSNHYMGWDGENNTIVRPFLDADNPSYSVDWIFMTADDYSKLLSLNVFYNTLNEAESLGVSTTEAEEVYSNPKTNTLDVINAANRSLKKAILAKRSESASEATPIDLTLSAINNPECNNVGGWEGLGEKGKTFAHQNASYTNGDVTINGFFENWVSSGSLPDCEISQLIDLPAGKYRLEADLIATNQNDENAVVTGVNLFANSDLAGTKACSTASEKPEHFSTVFYVIDGSVVTTFGVKLESTNANWVAVDNFKLYALGYDPVVSLQSVVKSAELFAGDVPTAISAALTNAINAAQAIINDPGSYSDSEKETAASNVTHALNAAEDAVTPYAKLNELIGKCTAIGMSHDIITNKNNLASADEINAAYDTLYIAYLAAACTSATDSNPVDLTSTVIINADCAATTGWEGIGANGSAFAYGSATYTNGEVTISKFLEDWKNNAHLPNAKLSQRIVSLPIGKYKLEADLIASWQNDGAQVVTGVSLFADGGKIQRTACYTQSEKPEHFSVTFYVYSVGATTIGVEIENCNANWVAVDNFRLSCLGLLADPLVAELEDLITEANAYLVLNEGTCWYSAAGESALRGVINDANATVAKPDVTTEEIENATTALTVQINAVKADIENYKSFKTSLVKALSIVDDDANAGYDLTALDSYIVELQTNYANRSYDAGEIALIEQNIVSKFNAAVSTAAQPGDNITFLLNNPDFASGSAAWTGTGTIGQGGMEFYNTTYDCYQIIYGLAPGFYKLTVDGFYRYLGDNSAPGADARKEAMANGGLEPYNAFLYGGTSEKALMSLFDQFSSSEFSKAGEEDISETLGEAMGITTQMYVPNTLAGAAYYVDNGMYAGNQLVFEVKADDTEVKVGIKKSVEASRDWTFVDNFQLYYMGQEDPALEKVTLNITDAGWATLILPYEAEIPEGFEAYSCDASSVEGANGVCQLALTSALKFEANIPYIVKGAPGTSYTFKGYNENDGSEELTSGWLTGVYTASLAPVDAYVLQNGAEGVGFYKVASGSQPIINAYRAYLNVPESSSVRVFSLNDGEATGLNAVVTDGNLVDVYTVSGTLVRKQVVASKALQGLSKGVYVVNGDKKVLK